MPSDRKPSLILPVAVVAVLLLAGYVGAYYRLVTFGFWVADVGVPIYTSEEGYTVDRVGYLAWEREDQRRATFFAPIHWFDRRIRRRVWERGRIRHSRLTLRRIAELYDYQENGLPR